jgi:predicted peroxiredoxin
MIPGISAFVTNMIKKEMEKIDIPPVREFIQMVKDSSCEIYGDKASVDIFHLTKKDFCKKVAAIISVSQFYE